MNDLTPHRPEQVRLTTPAEQRPYLPADPPLVRPIVGEASVSSVDAGPAEFVRVRPHKAVVTGLGCSATAPEIELPVSGHDDPPAPEPVSEGPPDGQTDPDEPAVEEGVHANALAANEAEPDAESPVDNTGDSTGPPTDLPPERPPSPEPDRGPELAKVINYAQNFRDEARKALEATVRTLPGGDEVIESLAARDILLEDAAKTIPATDEYGNETTVGSLFRAKEQAFARLQYSDALEASGLQLQEGNYQARLLMTDPEPFADALRTVTPPEDPEQREAFASQVGTIVDDSLATASVAIVDQHREEAEAMCGEYKYHVRDYPGWSPSTEQAAVGNALPLQADAIAQQLPRLQVSDDTTRQVRLLATANREGLVTEWGVAHKLKVLGVDYLRIGVAPVKIGSDYSWDPACKFLEHLRGAAPNAQFTNEVRRSVLDDLDAAAGTPLAQAAQRARERVLRILP